MIEINAKVNKEAGGNKCYKFSENDKEFDKIINICQQCKHIDEDSDFPNIWCDKSNEMIDYWFCLSECPTKKWKLVDKDENCKK